VRVARVGLVAAVLLPMVSNLCPAGVRAYPATPPPLRQRGGFFLRNQLRFGRAFPAWAAMAFATVLPRPQASR